jgi:hypothetical protein
MRNRSIYTLLLAAVVFALSAGIARADVCVSVDQAHDTFSDADRGAALILLARQFEAEGQQVVSEGCTARYQISHVKFGDTITVTLTGPGGQRQAVALGMNDVLALYSQLVRALLTGEEVGSMRKVVDRTNVIAAQAAPLRVQADSLFYVRLGYGGAVGNGSKAGPAMGLGFRRELDAFAIDMSFMNVQTQARRDYYYGGGGATGSFLKLEVLRFNNRRANSSAYWGGGASWGAVNASSGNTYWNGSGLQGELTAGYEMLRASNIRMFVQTDVVLPFYSATAVTYSYPRPPQTITDKRYMPSAAVSFGLGWGKGGRGRK